jgi:hypothetical protein
MLVLAIAACAATATPSQTAARLSDLTETTQAQPNYAQYYYGPYRRHCSLAARTKNIGSPALKLRFPRRDLIGMHVELLRQLSPVFDRP